jgi:hypothetical protein
VVAARAAAVAALAVSVLIPAGAAHAVPTSPSLRAEAAPPPDELVTFGIAPASGGRPDERSYVTVTAPPGSVLYDDVAIVNQSDVPLTLDVYAADAVNDAEGGLQLVPRAQARSESATWIELGQTTVDVAAQARTTGPGYTVVPVTITIPADAEPGDNLAAIVVSMTAEGRPGENTPAIDLEQRAGARIYVTVAGDIRPGLTIAGVKARYVAGGAFGSGTLEVSYTLVNSGNVRFGVEPSVRATGPFGLGARDADGRKIDELLPGSQVEQSVTLTGVWPMLFQNVTVSATPVATVGRDDPGLGTVSASVWTWAWSWIALIVVAVVAAAVALYVRRRRSIGVWPGRFGGAAGGPGSSPGGTGDGEGSPGASGVHDEPAPAHQGSR